MVLIMVFLSTCHKTALLVYYINSISAFFPEINKFQTRIFIYFCQKQIPALFALNKQYGFLKLDCSKLKNTFAWSPRWNIETVMDKTVEWTVTYLGGGDVTRCMSKQIKEFLREPVKKRAGRYFPCPSHESC